MIASVACARDRDFARRVGRRGRYLHNCVRTSTSSPSQGDRQGAKLAIMGEIDFVRRETTLAWTWLETTVSDVTPEQANWLPPGTANSIGATYIHLYRLHGWSHVFQHGGEIACLKGLQGATGYVVGIDALPRRQMNESPNA
jgi:hypothetical protein